MGLSSHPLLSRERDITNQINQEKTSVTQMNKLQVCTDYDVTEMRAGVQKLLWSEHVL